MGDKVWLHGRGDDLVPGIRGIWNVRVGTDIDGFAPHCIP